MAARKVVICGAGFLGKHIATNIAVASQQVARKIQLSSRHPTRLLQNLEREISPGSLAAIPVDVTKPATLGPAFEGAHTIVSLVGILHGSRSDFERIQWKGAENVALAAKKAGARLVHFSAIGADPSSEIMYAKTKGLGEAAVMAACPDATIIRPSLVFGPEDDFFNRFAKLSQYMPFLPVFGGGNAKFQPIYVGDIGTAVEAMTRGDSEIEKAISGKIMEAGGPEVFSYRQLMEIVLKYTGRRRVLLSLPFSVGMAQAAVLECLPMNLFTVTRDQVKQLQYDNIVNTKFKANEASFEDFLKKYCSKPLTSVHKILPTYLG